MRARFVGALVLVGGCAADGSTPPVVAPKQAGPSCSVRFEVRGTTHRGNVVLGLYADDATFLEEGHALRSVRVPADEFSTAFDLDDVPEGRYAAVVYQDENADGKLDRSFIGYPSEPFGFSNDASVGLFGPPSFSACAFEAKAPTTAVPITIR